MLKTIAQVTETIHVSKKPNAVFNYFSNHENDPLWRKGVISMAHTPRGPSHKGMHTREEFVLWGRKRLIMAIITQFEVGHMITFKTVNGGLEATGERKVVSKPGGSSISYQVGAKLTGLSALLVPLIKFSFRLRLRSDLLRLKQRLEAPQGAFPRI